ncbi:hypothetical protein B566_EDAN010413, partial [Ephemera danica]
MSATMKVVTAKMTQPAKKKMELGDVNYIMFSTWIAAFTVAWTLRVYDVEFGHNVPWWMNGYYWQNRYVEMIDALGGEYFIMTHGYLIPKSIGYWFTALPYLIVDITGRPRFLKKYKTQPGTNDPPGFWKVMVMLKIVIFNHILIGFIYGYFHYALLSLRELPSIYELPTFGRFFSDFLIMVVLYEPGLYYSHALLHHRWFYKRFHKLHHENTAMLKIVIFNHILIGFIYGYFHYALLSLRELPSIYELPTFGRFFSDFLIMVNLMPFTIVNMIVGNHVITFWFYMYLANAVSVASHSGYHVPFMLSPQMHDYHHVKFTECLGAMGWLDWLHNTDTSFRKSIEYQRHRILFTLKSAYEIWPDPKEKKIKESGN